MARLSVGRMRRCGALPIPVSLRRLPVPSTRPRDHMNPRSSSPSIDCHSRRSASTAQASLGRIIARARMVTVLEVSTPAR